jgi:phosphoglycerate dehydrogenase-like enzyme
VITIGLPRWIAHEFAGTIEAAAPGRVRLLPLDGEEEERGLDEVEIAVDGHHDGSLPFPELIARMPRLRWIHATGAGIESFASPVLGERGIVLTNSSGVYAPAMAEYIVAALGCIAHEFPRLLAAQRERRWDHQRVSGSELRGKRLGIVGYGLTGRYLAHICKALGMEVWATRRAAMLVAGEPVDRLLPAELLHELLAGSDYVVLTASLNATSRCLLGRDEFRVLKPGAGLVNVARGGLVDQDVLIEALGDGRIRGAVLDVVDPEPLPPDSPLWSLPNVIVTSHISGGTPEGWARSIELFCLNLRLYLEGRSHLMANIVELGRHL